MEAGVLVIGSGFEDFVLTTDYTDFTDEDSGFWKLSVLSVVGLVLLVWFGGLWFFSVFSVVKMIWMV